MPSFKIASTDTINSKELEMLKDRKYFEQLYGLFYLENFGKLVD